MNKNKTIVQASLIEKFSKITSIVTVVIITLGFIFGMQLSRLSIDHFAFYIGGGFLVSVIGLIIIDGFYYKQLKPIEIITIYVLILGTTFITLGVGFIMLMIYKAFVIIYVALGIIALYFGFVCALMIIKVSHLIKQSKNMSNITEKSKLDFNTNSMVKIDNINKIYSVILFAIFITTVIIVIILHHTYSLLFNSQGLFYIIPFVIIILDWLFWKKIPLYLNAIFPALIMLPLCVLVFMLGQASYGSNRFHVLEFYNEPNLIPYILMYTLLLLHIPTYVIAFLKIKIKLSQLTKPSIQE